MMRRTIWIHLLATLALMLTFNSTKSLSYPIITPQSTLLEYIRLTHYDADYGNAYAYLSRESQSEVSRAEFIQSGKSLSALSMAPQIPADYLDMASRISEVAHSQTTYSIVSSSSDGTTAYITVRFIMPDMESITMDIFSEMLDPSRYSGESNDLGSTDLFLSRLEDKMRTSNRVALDQVYTLVMEDNQWKILIDFRLQQMLSSLMAQSQDALAEGDYSSALKTLEHVLELDKSNPQAIEQLAKVKQMKRTQDDLDDIRTLLESGSNSQARVKLEALLDNPALDPSIRPVIENLMLLLDLNTNNND